MDRVAFLNMTSKNRNVSDINSQTPLRHISQLTGELTTKSKIGTQVNNYYLERQSKNASEYNNFVAALNNNITEDRYRTSVNNDQFLTEQPNGDNFQRVYHPTLMTEQERNFDNADRCGLGTRDRQVNAVAVNKNTTHPILTPMPKLNYPQGYDQLKPIEMDMTSQLESQFSGLTNQSMEQQIALLNKSVQSSDNTNSRSVNDIVMCRSQPNYNPQVDHLNQQLFQLSQQIPPQQAFDCSRILDFQRPLPSNNKLINTRQQFYTPIQSQLPLHQSFYQPQLQPQPQPEICHSSRPIQQPRRKSRQPQRQLQNKNTNHKQAHRE